MIAAFFAWLPGNTVIDWFAIVGTLLLAAFFGWLLVVGAGLIVDWRRSLKPLRPFGEAASVVAVPEVERKSPFAGKRVAK